MTAVLLRLRRDGSSTEVLRGRGAHRLGADAGRLRPRLQWHLVRKDMESRSGGALLRPYKARAFTTAPPATAYNDLTERLCPNALRYPSRWHTHAPLVRASRNLHPPTVNRLTLLVHQLQAVRRDPQLRGHPAPR